MPEIERKALKGDLVIPVILQRCSWQFAVGVLQAVPTTAEGRLCPVVDWRPKANGFHAAQQQLDQALTDHLGRGPASPFTWGRP